MQNYRGRGVAIRGYLIPVLCRPDSWSNTSMRFVVGFLTLLASFSAAQTAPSAPPAHPVEDYSGTYSFVREGEFVQVTVEEEGKVTGFVSRFGESDTDRDLVLDHFFKQGKLDDKKLSFSTETVHGTWYEFKGVVERGEGKDVGDEAYYVLKGTLTQNGTDAQKKTTTQSRDVVFKRFPQNLGDTPEDKPKSN